MNKVDGTSGSSFEKDLAFYESDEGSFRDGYIGKYLAIIAWISQIDPSGDWRSCDYYEYSDY